MIWKILCIFLFLATAANSQESLFYNHINYSGDTIKLPTIADPTVCDCIKKNRSNLDQKKICGKKFDYDFMTEEEQRDFNAKKEICKNPSICDCAKASLLNAGLIKVCDNEYRFHWMNDTEKNDVLSIMHDCTEDDLSYPKLIAQSMQQIEICDCININDNRYDLKKKCNKLFFDEENISQDQIEKNAVLLQDCIENNNFSINPTVCECHKYASSDIYFQTSCSEKFDTTKMSSNQLKDYKTAKLLCTELSFYRRLNSLHDSLTSERSNIKPNEQLNFFRDEESSHITEKDNSTAWKKNGYEYGVKQLIINTAKIQICDCAGLRKSEQHRMNECMDYFRLNYLPPEDLVILKSIIHKYSIEIKTVCECLRANDGSMTESEKDRCKKLIAPLSTSELIKFMNGTEKCD